MDNNQYNSLLNKMINLQGASENNYDDSHLEADRILCQVLTELGYSELVEAWKNVGKWYW